MKKITLISFLFFSVTLCDYAIEDPRSEQQAVITTNCMDHAARQWLIDNLESLKLLEGKAVLKFRNLAEGSPTSGHPVAARENLRGKELILSKRSELFFLEEPERSCTYIVKNIDAKAIHLACIWESARSQGIIQSDRANFTLRPIDVSKTLNQI